jgi:lysophospholipase L1-like esterase
VATAANRWLNRIGTIVGATVLNAGIAGTVLQNSADASGSSRTDNGRNRFASAVAGANLKEAVFIAYGFNDARYIGAPATFNASNYANDYREVLNGLRTLGYAREDIYVLAPYFITNTGLSTFGSDPNFSGQTRTGFEAFVTAAETVAREFGVRFCNLYAELNTPAFIANVDGNDHIHPTDSGHAFIATAIQSRTVELNARSAPASVTPTPGPNKIDVTCEAVSGASGYEFILVSGYVDGTTLAEPLPSTSFASLTVGAPYRIKVRATFGDGSKSPWTFAPADVSATGTAGIFAQDTFTDAAGASLVAHTPETGGPWVAQPGVTTNEGRITGAGRLRPNQASCMFQVSASPGSADHYAEADVVFLSEVSGTGGGVAVRMSEAAHTAYFGRWAQGGSGWQIYKTIAGTSTLLNSTTSAALNASNPIRRIRLEVTGAVDPVLTLKVDGAVVLTVTDNSGTRITAAGKVGVRCNRTTALTDTSGAHLDNFAAGTL